MSELFVTQIDQNPPEVLVIGEGGLLSVVSEVVQAYGLVPRASNDNASTLVSALAARSEWYKICWVVDLTKPKADIQEVVQLLRPIQNKLIIVANLVTPIATTFQPWQNWQKLSLFETQQIEFVRAVLPKSKLVVVRDWIQNQSWSELLKSWVLFDKKTVLLDPRIQVFPLAETGLKALLSKVLFHPTSPNQVILQGAPQNSAHFVQLIQAVYHRTHGVTLATDVQPVVSLELGEQLSVLVSPEINVDSNSLVKQVVKLLPSPAQLAAQHRKDEKPSFGLEKPQRTITPQSENQDAQFIKRVPLVPLVPQVTQVPQAAPPAAPPPAPRQVLPQKPLVQEMGAEQELEKTVADLFSNYRSDYRQAQTLKKVSSTQNITKRSKRKKKVFLVGLASFAVVFVLISMVGSFLTAGWIIKRNIGSVLTIDIKTPTVIWGLKQVSGLLSAESQLFATILPPGVAHDSHVLVNTLADSIRVSHDLESWQQKQLTMIQSVLQPDRNPGAISFESASGLYQSLAKLQGTLKEIDPETLTAPNQQQLEEFQKNIALQIKKLNAYEQLQPYLQEYLGLSKKRTYALIFQNEQELRPTGGFIQAIILVTLDKGSIVNTQVLSSYELDSKLAGEVKPPEDIQNYLGEQRWYLRDSNWSPDFPTSANQIAWFIERSTGQKVDGVVGLTGKSFQTLVKALGPIELPEFNETITDRNLAERLEFHSEIQFAQLSDKPDYTSVLLRRFWAQLEASPTEKIAAVLQAFGQSLEQQDLMVSMIDAQENQPLQGLGWAGDLVTPACPSQLSAPNCVVDTLAQVEANVGINKANYYVAETVSHDITLSPTKIQHKQVVSIQNEAQTNAWPKGPYKAFIRWYVPSESELVGISVNGVLVPPSQITSRKELGKTVWGILLETAIQAESTVELVYARPLPYSNDFAYAYFDQKQPGTSIDSKIITVSYDSSFVPKVVAPQASLSTGKITFSDLSQAHALVGILFK